MDHRKPFKAHLFNSTSTLDCELAWQGDFGTGQPTGSGIWSDPGANPCILYGPASAAGVSNQGVPLPNWKLGMTINGDTGAEFVYCRFVAAGAPDLIPGQAYFWDENFNATIQSATVASNLTNAEVGLMQVFFPAVPNGTYFAWLQRAGHAAISAVAASVANGFGETNAATAGALKFVATPTVGQRSVLPSGAFGASSSITFTANSLNGSPTLSNVISQVSLNGAVGGITDLVPGMTITGTGLPANSCIAAIRKTGNNWAIDIGTATAGAQKTLQNATATNTATTFTVTSHVAGNMYWPTYSKTN